MYANDLYMAEKMMRMRVEEEHRRADQRSLQRLAREGQRARNAQPGDRLLVRLGSALQALGRRLELHGQPPAQRLPECRSGVSGGP